MMGVIRMAGSDEWFMRVRRCDALPFVSLFLELSRKCYVLSTLSYVKEHRNVTPILTFLSLSISPSLQENGLSERILKNQTKLEFNDAPATGREIAKRKNQRHTVERVGKQAGKTTKQEEKKLRKGKNKNNEKMEKEGKGERKWEREKNQTFGHGNNVEVADRFVIRCDANTFHFGGALRVSSRRQMEEQRLISRRLNRGDIRCTRHQPEGKSNSPAHSVFMENISSTNCGWLTLHQPRLSRV